MKVQPIAAPAAQAPQQGNSAREKAIAAFMGPGQTAASASPQMAVHNQNAISPEEITGNTSVPIKTEETGQADSTESQVAKTETPEEQALSRQFAQLARQEKAIRLQQQSLKQREDALKAKESQVPQVTEPDYSNYVQKDLFKKDPLAALQQAGISYDELTQQFLSTPLDPRVENHISQLEAKLKSFEEKFGNLEKSAQESETQAYQAAVKQIEIDVKSMVATDPAYEMIKATNSYKDVVQLIEETYKKDGILLSNDEAAQQVEDYLTEEAIKLSSTNKIKSKLAAVAPKPAVVQQPTQTQKPQMKTLTNAQSSSRQLSARERAIAAFNGNKT